jgi:hypothetical protein
VEPVHSQTAAPSRTAALSQTAAPTAQTDLLEARAAAPPALRPAARGLFAGGTTGNELLTSVTGAALIFLLAVIGVTILSIGQLLSVHLFVGLVLLGPIALKLVSTGYRFVRYYTGNPRYRGKGAPPMQLRLLAPLVVVSTAAVMASGVALLIAGPQARGTFLVGLHKASFVVWLAVTSVHVLAHLPETWRGLGADYGSRLLQTPDGRAGRALALAAALVLGVVIAILFIPMFGPWLSVPLHNH